MVQLHLNTKYSFVTDIGLVAVPGMFHPSAGLSSCGALDLKIILNFDKEIAHALGIRPFPCAPLKTPRIAMCHQLLLSTYAGVCLSESSKVKDMLWPFTPDHMAGPTITDAGTIAYILTRQSALDLGYFTTAENIEEDTVYILAHGASSEAFVDLFSDTYDYPLDPSTVAAFCASRRINPPVRTIEGYATKIAANGNTSDLRN